MFLDSIVKEVFLGMSYTILTLIFSTIKTLVDYVKHFLNKQKKIIIMVRFIGS